MGNWIVLFFSTQWKNPLLFNKKGLEKYLKSGFITRLNREKKWIKHCNLTFSISFFLVNEIVNYLSQPLGFFYCTSQASLSFCLFPIDIFLTCENSVSSRVFYVFFWSPFTAWTETSYPSLPSKVGVRSGFGQFPARIYGWTRSTYSGWCVSTIQISIWILFKLNLIWDCRF